MKIFLVSLAVIFFAIVGAAVAGLIGPDYAVAGCFGTMVLFAGVGFLSLKSDHPNLAPQRGGQWLMR
jgi:hypothetical protein